MNNNILWGEYYTSGKKKSGKGSVGVGVEDWYRTGTQTLREESYSDK